MVENERTDREVLHFVERVDEGSDNGDVHSWCFELLEGVGIICDLVSQLRSRLVVVVRKSLPTLVIISLRILSACQY